MPPSDRSPPLPSPADRARRHRADDEGVGLPVGFGAPHGGVTRPAPGPHEEEVSEDDGRSAAAIAAPDPRGRRHRAPEAPYLKAPRARPMAA